jgi:hypothetical protein
VAHIDPDQHGSFIVHSFWELHGVQVAPNLTVNLPKDI